MPISAFKTNPTRRAAIASAMVMSALSIASCSADESTPDAVSEPEAAVPETTGEWVDPGGVFRVPLRVHMGRSALTDPEVNAVLAELNALWLAQADICFEVTLTTDDTPATDGFDLYLSAAPLFGNPSTNGIYRGPHDVWSLDRPRLSPSSNPIAYPAARTSAHELGHGLGLSHQNCGRQCPCGASLGLDCDDFLMRSGYDGFVLSAPEVARAREHAASIAPSDTSLPACAPPSVTKPGTTG